MTYFTYEQATEWVDSHSPSSKFEDRNKMALHLMNLKNTHPDKNTVANYWNDEKYWPDGWSNVWW